MTALSQMIKSRPNMPELPEALLALVRAMAIRQARIDARQVEAANDNRPK